MYALSTTLLVLSASALLVQAGSIPATNRNSIEETKDVNIGNNGISIKTGYEGYVASVDQTPKSRKSDFFSQIDNFSKADLLTKISMLKNGLLLVGKLVMPLALKVLVGAKIITTVLSFSFLITYGMCRFTSLCAFDVNMPFKQQELEARIKNLASPYISEQTLEDTMSRVRSALGALNTIQAIQEDIN